MLFFIGSFKWFRDINEFFRLKDLNQSRAMSALYSALRCTFGMSSWLHNCFYSAD